MSPNPGEPLDPKQPDLTTADGRKVKLRHPGLPTPAKPTGSGERGAAEPPREDTRPPGNPDAGS